jgi:hypothetical protein
MPIESPAPPLAPHVELTLAAFAEAGITPTFREAGWLVKLREPCDNPESGALPWQCGAPFEYAGVEWYPLHNLASTWMMMMEVHLKQAKSRVLVYAACFLFAHAHSAVGDGSLRKWWVPAKAQREAVRWFRDLPMHIGQTAGLMDRLRELDSYAPAVPDPNGKAQAASGVDMRRAIGVMMKAFPGTSAEFWWTGCSTADATAYMGCQSGGVFATSPARNAAIENYLKAVRWVWRLHQHG